MLWARGAAENTVHERPGLQILKVHSWGAFRVIYLAVLPSPPPPRALCKAHAKQKIRSLYKAHAKQKTEKLEHGRMRVQSGSREPFKVNASPRKSNLRKILQY